MIERFLHVFFFPRRVYDRHIEGGSEAEGRELQEQGDYIKGNKIYLQFYNVYTRAANLKISFSYTSMQFHYSYIFVQFHYSYIFVLMKINENECL